MLREFPYPNCYPMALLFLLRIALTSSDSGYNDIEYYWTVI